MNPYPILECVPNFSDGRDLSVVNQIIASMHVGSVQLLDFSLDPDHNRSVVTIAGPPAEVTEAAILGVGTAARLIDLTKQKGVHPRVGAADVIPFVPISGISLAEAANFARQAGHHIWQRFGVPVYFYGAAAARSDRIHLEDVRRGGFEGLAKNVLEDAARQPDIGGPGLHPTAGATIVGARDYLIAYNIYLTADAKLSQGRAIARAVRGSSGGLQGIKALGVLVNGCPQVTMNITDFRVTPISELHATVARLAHREGTTIANGELIGLIPEAAYDPSSCWSKEIPGFDPEQKILERRINDPLEWPEV